MLELRDRRRISIPLSLLRSPMGDFEETVMSPAILLFGFDDWRSVGDSESSRGGFVVDRAEDEGDDDISVVWEDSVLPEVGKELMCVEDNETPLVVTPLAMAVPPEEVSYGGEITDKTESEAAPPSNWVLDELQHSGEVLGASYAGHEMEIMNLLMTIDASCQQARHATRANKHSTKSGNKSSRELKNLISNINYDSGSSKCRNNNRDKVLVVSK